MFTNINIKTNNDSYQYIIEYIKSDNIYVDDNISYQDSFDLDNIGYINDLMFVSENTNFIKNKNMWEKSIWNNIASIKPTNHPKKSYIRLHFPEYSADIYNPGIAYALTVATWINGKCVVLASTILQRGDAEANDRVKRFCNHSYHEHIEIDIIDPFHLQYSDDWKEFREIVCGERPGTNTTESMLYVTLHPVERVNDNLYIKIDNLDGGQNTMMLTKSPNEFLNLSITPNTDKYLGNKLPAIDFKVSFNEEYNGNLHEYIRETYGLDDYQIQYGLVIGNENDIYAVVESDELDMATDTYSFDKKDIASVNSFNNGEGYKEGLFIVGSLDITTDDESVIYKLSNKIPLTEDLFRYIVNSGEFVDKHNYTINSVDLNDVNMELINLNVVNKIENKIIQVANSHDSKSNIVQPVFYRVSELGDLLLHAAVTENVCVNLDKYKSKVNSFYIQIGGVTFPEVGRVHSGVLFKIIGKQLGSLSERGIYYILDENQEMITSGKYTCE